MPTISTAEKVVCAWERCDLTICTNEGGDQPLHYLERDQMERLVRPRYSDSPFQRQAFDLDGVEHEAVIPPGLFVERLVEQVGRARLRAFLRMLPRCPWIV